MLDDMDIFKAVTFRCKKCDGEEICAFEIDRNKDGDFLITTFCHGYRLQSRFSERIISVMIKSQPKQKFTAMCFDGPNNEDQRVTVGDMPKEPDIAELIWGNRDAP